MLTRPANFILMDEPTNHLDIPSREILTDALDAYTGTICFITHDRTLIREIANKIVEIKDGDARMFNGNYDEFMERQEPHLSDDKVPETLRVVRQAASSTAEKREQQRLRRIAEGNLRNEHFRVISPVKKRIGEIEEKVDILTTRIAQIEELFADPNHYQDGFKVAETNREYIASKEQIRKLTTEWDKLTAEAEKLVQEYEAAKEELEK
jgi:ATP-binding cassette, subfamily F, member 3